MSQVERLSTAPEPEDSDRISGVRQNTTGGSRRMRESFQDLIDSDDGTERTGKMPTKERARSLRATRFAEQAETLSPEDYTMDLEDADIETIPSRQRATAKRELERLARADKRKEPEALASRRKQDARKAFEKQRATELEALLAEKQREQDEREERIANLRRATREARERTAHIQREEEDARWKSGVRELVQSKDENSSDFEERAEAVKQEAREQYAEIQQEAREQAAPERARQESVMETDLERNEQGEVIGLKNVPEVNGLAVYKGMASAMKRINREIAWAYLHLSGRMQDRRIRQLEEDAVQWRGLYNQLEEKRERGESPEQVVLENPFYQAVDRDIPEGMSRVDFETALITPEEQLKREEHRLIEREREMIQSLNQTVDLIDDLGNLSAHQREIDVHESVATREESFQKVCENYLDAQENDFAYLDAEIQGIHALKDPQKADIEGARLSAEIDSATSQIETLKKELKTFNKNAGVTKELNEKIQAQEQRLNEATRELQDWQGNKERSKAIEARIKDLEAREEQIIAQKRVLSMRMADTRDQMDQHQQIIDQTHASADRVAEQYFSQALREEETILFDAHAYYTREIMRASRELEDIRSLREEKELDIDVNVDLSGLEEDIDLSELNSSARSSANTSQNVA